MSKRLDKIKELVDQYNEYDEIMSEDIKHIFCEDDPDYHYLYESIRNRIRSYIIKDNSFESPLYMSVYNKVFSESNRGHIKKFTVKEKLYYMYDIIGGVNNDYIIFVIDDAEGETNE
ncbi:MAG: hypothetical protein JRL30_20340 [Deltaproteobacteria bacterium]|nr:hypothetical protein [Deltaproteobacteria bacterium]